MGAAEELDTRCNPKTVSVRAFTPIAMKYSFWMSSATKRDGVVLYSNTVADWTGYADLALLANQRWKK